MDYLVAGVGVRSPATLPVSGSAAGLRGGGDHPVIGRRVFVRRLGAAAIALAGPRESSAQHGQKRIPIVGYVAPGIGPSPLTKVFAQSLERLGYVAGQNISIQYRFWAGDTSRLPGIMSELVGRNADVIVAGDSSASRTAKQATRTIPIVSISTDPIGERLVENLARPEGNVTGFAFVATPTTGKLLELLKEALPGLSRLGVLDEPQGAANSAYLAHAQAAATSLNITLHIEHVRAASDFKPALDALVKARVQAVTGSARTLTFAHRKTVIALALERRLPIALGLPLYARDGALIGFGANHSVVNLKTAEALGLTIPQVMLLRADEVIR